MLRRSDLYIQKVSRGLRDFRASRSWRDAGDLILASSVACGVYPIGSSGDTGDAVLYACVLDLDFDTMGSDNSEIAETTERSYVPIYWMIR